MNYETDYFQIDNTKSFKGITSGQLWNGWECPLFNKESIDSIIDEFICINTHYDMNIYFKGVNLVVIEYGEKEILTPTIIDGVNYYDLGWCAWTWEKTNR